RGAGHQRALDIARRVADDEDALGRDTVDAVLAGPRHGDGHGTVAAGGAPAERAPRKEFPGLEELDLAPRPPAEIAGTRPCPAPSPKLPVSSPPRTSARACRASSSSRMPGITSFTPRPGSRISSSRCVT